LHQQKQKFSEKRKQSSGGLFESQSMGPKQSEKGSAMEWASSETDNFVNINKFIFSNHEDDSNEFSGPISAIGARVKSLPKNSIFGADIVESEHQLPSNTMKFSDLEGPSDRMDIRAAKYSGFFSTMKLTSNEGLFPSAHNNAVDGSSNPKPKGKIQVYFGLLVVLLVNLVN
jgi:hypothetical protein